MDPLKGLRTACALSPTRTMKIPDPKNRADRNFILQEAVSKLMREKPGTSYDEAWRTVNSAPEFAEIVAGMSRPQAQKAMEDTFVGIMGIKPFPPDIAKIIDKLKAAPVGENFRVDADIAEGKVRTPDMQAAASEFAAKVQELERDFGVSPAFSAAAIKEQHPELYNRMKGRVPTPTVDARKAAGAKFTGMVLAAQKAQGITYDEAWQRMKQQEPGLWAAMR